MSITVTRFATHTRTWLLIAALTGLLIAIGAAIGGGALYLFAVLAVGMNLVGYWFSDRIALRASRAQPVQPGRLPELEAMVEDLAGHARVPVPRLYLIPSEQPNAFATGRDPEHAAVAVTEGLLAQLPAQEVRAVLAHEFGHIKNHDILISSIASMLLQLAVSRQREYLADDTGAQLLGRAAPLADAPESLEREAQAIPMNVNPAEASLYAIAERIRRLRALDGNPVVRLAA